jgi:membrane-bound lytic murein transglycosylase B
MASSHANFVNQPKVQHFIDKMVAKHHFDRTELVDIFTEVKIRPRVMQSVRAPLEAEKWYTYERVFITESRIREGVAFWDRHADTLARAEQIYGVPASIIVATIGVETKYGKNKGEYPVIDALSNIAFSNSPRAPYFMQELEEFLLLAREQHLDPLKIRGSYAGAIGQPQFMPSSYRHYAINFSGNAHIDLSNNEQDIIGSVANYYNKHGWYTNQPVAVPALIEKNHYQFLLNKPQIALDEHNLAEYGIHPYTNRKLPPNQKMKLIELQNFRSKEYWLALHNFEVIKRYNPSNLYAMAVYQLSYYIHSLRERNHA